MDGIIWFDCPPYQELSTTPRGIDAESSHAELIAMSVHFGGDFEDLRRLLEQVKCEGQWSEPKPDCFQFRTKEGAILNWFASTGNINFQGPDPGRSKLENRVTNAIAAVMEVEDEGGSGGGRERGEDGQGGGGNDRKKVFVVHGHDHVAREQLELVLHKLGLYPFVLSNTGGGGQTIIEALENETGPKPGRARFGIVLMTPDDIGFAKKDGPEKSEPRARQNVVMEMGMLISAIGRNNVAILKKGHLEVPSNVDGIIYLSFNEHVKEIVPKLVDRLREAGFDLDKRAITDASS